MYVFTHCKWLVYVLMIKTLLILTWVAQYIKESSGGKLIHLCSKHSIWLSSVIIWFLLSSLKYAISPTTSSTSCFVYIHYYVWDFFFCWLWFVYFYEYGLPSGLLVWHCVSKVSMCRSQVQFLFCAPLFPWARNSTLNAPVYPTGDLVAKQHQWVPGVNWRRKFQLSMSCIMDEGPAFIVRYGTASCGLVVLP